MEWVLVGTEYRVHMLSECVFRFRGGFSMCFEAASRASAYILTYLKAERGFWLKLTKILPNLQILKYLNWIPSVHILVIIF